MFVGDLRRHAREVSGFLLLTDARGGSLEAGLVPHEGVVRGRSVEAQHGARVLALGMALGIGVPDDGHHRNDEIDRRRIATSRSGALGHVGHHVSTEIAGFADGMHVHTVGDLAGHAQHPGVHRGHVHLGVGRVDLARTPLRSDEGKVVELAVVVEGRTAERREAGLHREDVVTHARTRPREFHAVAPFDVSLHLRAEPQTESTAGGLLQFPRGGRGHER